jgi:hypothetical protein
MMNASIFPPAHLSRCLRIFIESLLVEAEGATLRSQAQLTEQVGSRFVDPHDASLCVHKHTNEVDDDSSETSILVA